MNNGYKPTKNELGDEIRDDAEEIRYLCGLIKRGENTPADTARAILLAAKLED